ncbi:MAG: aminotransferase class V-fold PLP-dependent enzyme [Bacteroidota bacterium]
MHLPIAIRDSADLSAELIHFNNAGGALPYCGATEAMQQYLLHESRYGAYETAHTFADKLQAFYLEIARYLNARPDQIARAESATRAFNRGILSIPWERDDIILTTKSDYISNHLVFLQLQQKFGINIDILPEGKSGYEPAALAARIRTGKRPRLVSITHVPTNSGLVQDVSWAGKLCREYDILFAVDACQSAGQLPLDVQAIQCDFLSATFRKYLRGPRGIGFLYVSDRVLQSDMTPLGLDSQGADWVAPDQFKIHPNASRFETWEESKILKIGAANAMAYLNEITVDFVQARIQFLNESLLQRLAGLAALEVHRFYENQERLQTGIHLMNVPDWKKGPAVLIEALKEKGLNATTSGVGNDQYHFRERGIEWALRLSIHYYNTETEIDRAIDILREVL